jgi:uncharacterized protein YuzE
MKINYYSETDSLYIELSAKPSADSKEVAKGLVVDFDSAGNIVGLDIDHASKVVDLENIESLSVFPLKTKPT